MKRLLALYPYVAPVVLAPLSYWLWLRTYAGNHHLVVIAWGLPVLWAYIVPGVGTNILKVWEFDTRLRLGRFRPHHGFVFGSATATLAWLSHHTPAQDLGDAFRNALVLASVLGFWNLLYDIKALEVGLLRVYNQPCADGQPASVVALDYAPWFFAGFGGVYGFAISLAEMNAERLLNWPVSIAWLLLSLLCACCVPVAGYVLQSRRRYGHSGTRPIHQRTSK
ncbi:hypothetical protein [Niveibacterium sp. COAC-50]|uniref:hypothetical protein n=1 Tax=Niveibacterium sp. COAC-50 TaxID=2729384 RepID=UPI0015569B37|nr:hypothetical protein [Niveibacterium sp. COAC-50]